MRITGSNAGYTMSRGSVKGTGYQLHSPVSPSLPLPCVTVCHYVSSGLYCGPRLFLTCSITAKPLMYFLNIIFGFNTIHLTTSRRFGHKHKTNKTTSCPVPNTRINTSSEVLCGVQPPSLLGCFATSTGTALAP